MDCISEVLLPKNCPLTHCIHAPLNSLLFCAWMPIAKQSMHAIILTIRDQFIFTFFYTTEGLQGTKLTKIPKKSYMSVSISYSEHTNSDICHLL